MRGERQPWGAEDTAFVFLETATGAVTRDEQDSVRNAVVEYARKRPDLTRGKP